MIPLYDANNTLLSSMVPYNFAPNQPPIHKTYNISLSDPLGNHSLINKVYEDVLPSDQTTYSFIKLNERETIKTFMRNSILDKYDREELTLKGGDKCLLSWVKIFDINPYTLKKSPYEDIPNGFLLYRSAYPIRYNKEDHVLKTALTATAINLRIYKLSVGALNSLNNKTLECDYFDVWRDIEYYKWVDTIIKRKISPNFLNLILHVLDNKSKIGFKDLDVIKKRKNRDIYELQQTNIKKIHNTFSLTLEELATGKIDSKNKNIFSNLPQVKQRVSVGNNNNNIVTMDDLLNNNDELNKSLSLLTSSISKLKDHTNDTVPRAPTLVDLTIDSNKILVALSEAPNTNIIKWNSMVYQSHGTVKKMIATGYHKLEVWNSILFQLIYACAVMENQGIYFNNFSLKNNVFIKDIQSDGTGKSCWVYKVNNIEYYVPNYGYILVIDSNYADITTESDVMQYKIYGSIFNQNGNMNSSDFGKKLKEQLLLELTNDKFQGEHGNELEKELQEKLNHIMSKIQDTTNINISDILPYCFKEFVNSKVGNLLTKLEKESLNVLAKPVYRQGCVMVRQKRYDEYDWVIYLGTDNNKKKVIHKNSNGKLEIISVFSSSLYSYPDNVLPEDKSIIETYTYFN